MRSTSALCFQSCLAIALYFGAEGLAAAETAPDPDILAVRESALTIIGKWRGIWDVKATRREPPPVQDVTYTETSEWVLDGRFLRSETSRKSDGGQSMSMFWFDVFTKTYRLVIFDAAGFAVELPPPTWDDRTQTMEWKTGLFSPTSFTGTATFVDRDTIRWKSLWKDWKGTAILDLEGLSTRRK